MVIVKIGGGADINLAGAIADRDPRLVRQLRIHRHRADTEAARRAHDAAGDLAAVGNQDLVEHCFGLGSGGGR